MSEDDRPRDEPAAGMDGSDPPATDPAASPDAAGSRRGPRRRVALIGCAAIVAVAVVAAVLVHTRWSNHELGTRPSARPSTSATARCRPQVVDTGFTIQAAHLAGKHLAYRDRVVGGAVIKNSCPNVAVNTRFVVYGLDADGKRIPVADPVPGHPDVLYDRGNIPVIMPGATVTIEAEFEPVGRHGNYDLRDVADLDVRLSSTCWLHNPSASPYRVLPKARDVAVRSDDDGLPADGGTVSFTVSRASEPGAPLTAAVLFRDGSGDLLYVTGGPLPEKFRSGSRQTVHVWLPPNADPKRTQVVAEPNPGPEAWPHDTTQRCIGT